jgi:hypothetical protein
MPAMISVCFEGHFLRLIQIYEFLGLGKLFHHETPARRQRSGCHPQWVFAAANAALLSAALEVVIIGRLS